MHLWSHLLSLLHFLSASAWPGLASANQRLYAAISPWPRQRWDRNTAALTILFHESTENGWDTPSSTFFSSKPTNQFKNE